MKNGNRWTQACLALLVNACLGTPSTAQGLAAQSAKIAELERAGKYAKAIPLAQAMLANREKGPASRDLADALDNLTQLYGDVGRDADAELLHKRALAIMEKAVEPAAETARQVRALLSDDEALLLFAIAEQEPFVFALTRQGFDRKRIPPSAEVLSRQVAAFRGGLDVSHASDASGKSALFDLARANELKSW